MEISIQIPLTPLRVSLWKISLQVTLTPSKEKNFVFKNFHSKISNSPKGEKISQHKKERGERENAVC